jgi:hypothetical protein
MLVLQSNTDSLHILQALSGESASCDGVGNIQNMEVEEYIGVKEEGCLNEEVDLGIKQEEIREDIFTDTKAEPDEVNYVCVYVCYYAHFTSVSNVRSFCDVRIL